jgi:membrane associated rhomboid family serine protease
MVFPIGDDNTDRTGAAVVTILLIAINVLVFVFLQGLGTNERFTYAFSTVPQEILTGRDAVTPDRTIEDPLTGQTVVQPGLQRTPGSVYLTLLVSMFMHAGIAHLFGNMLFLWIFGDNVENALGRARFLIFYLLCGFIAGLAHVFSTAVFGGDPLIPSLGASGAISGVLGAYTVLFPHRRVRVIVLRMITQMPAYMAIGIWFLFQVVTGLGMFGSGSQTGGVAYAAHIGGFIAGVILIRLFGRASKLVRA